MLVPRVDIPINGEGTVDLGALEAVTAWISRLGCIGDVAVIVDEQSGGQDIDDVLASLVRRATVCVYNHKEDEDGIRRLLRAGARKFCLGENALRELLTRLPRSRLVLALQPIDCSAVGSGLGSVTSAVSRMQVLAPYCGGFTASFIDCTGGMADISVDAVKALAAATNLPVTVQGAVASADEVAILDRLGVDVLVPVIDNDNPWSPEDAFVACMDFSGGGLTIVVVDRFGQVLDLRRMDEESLNVALRSAKIAGPNGLEAPILRCLPARDRKSVVIKVEPSPPADKHRYSKFGDGTREFGLFRLFEGIKHRRDRPVPGSYTSFLFEKPDRIPRKLNEEVYELLTADTLEDITWEAADVLYFLFAYVAKQGVELEEIVAELGGRER